MAYVELNEIVLETNFSAKDITIVNYNATIAKIKEYLEQLRGNTEQVLNDILRGNTPIPYIHFGYSIPEGTVVNEGDFFFEVTGET